MSLSTTASTAPSGIAHSASSSGHGGRQSTRGWWRTLWSRRDGRIEEIRRLMLTQTGAIEAGEARALLIAKIVAATQTQALWQLRGELTTALVEVHGELLARQRVTDISFMFAGLLECDRRSLQDNSETGVDWPYASYGQGQMRGGSRPMSSH